MVLIIVGGLFFVRCARAEKKNARRRYMSYNYLAYLITRIRPEDIKRQQCSLKLFMSSVEEWIEGKECKEVVKY